MQTLGLYLGLMAFICLLIEGKGQGPPRNINPHRPVKMTWTLCNEKTQKLLLTISKTAPPNTWWPDLYFCLRDLIPEYAKAHPILAHENGFYSCPGHDPQREARCGGPEEAYCLTKDCASSSDGRWKWDSQSSDLVKMTYVNQLRQTKWKLIGTQGGVFFGNPDLGAIQRKWLSQEGLPCKQGDLDRVRIQFTEAGRQERRWDSGLPWSIVYNLPGNQPFSLLVIKQKIELIPDPLLPTLPPTTTTITTTTTATTTTAPTTVPPTTPNLGIGSIVELSKGNRNRRHLLSMPETSSDPLWSMVVAAEKALRLAKPDVEPCWLCFDPHPPYYEAIGMNGTYVIKNENNPTQCRWDSSQAFQGGLRMDVIQGRGKCVGPVPKEKQKLCDNIESKLNTEGWVVPNTGSWWMCSKAGLTPCISASVLSSSNEFCMQVIIVPKAKYRNLTDLYDYHRPSELPRAKREAITAISVATLVGLGMAGVGTGIAALTLQNQGLSSLKAAILEDLTEVRTAIINLEQSHSSLAEVVLQNRRGLDLVFQRENGVCAALGEECCYYTDRTGVVRDSMAKLGENLAKRKKELESHQTWFNKIPWLTNLISSLAGPLVIVLFLLTLGPCILNKLVSFVKDQTKKEGP